MTAANGSHKRPATDACEPRTSKKRMAHDMPGLEGSLTAAIHGDTSMIEEGSVQAALLSTHADIAPPLSVSTTFEAPVEKGRGHIYSRETNPTRARCEQLLGAIMSAPGAPAHAILYSSGLAAAFAVLSHLRPRRVAITGGYHGTHAVLAQLKHIAFDDGYEKLPLMQPAEVAASALQKGDVLWLETPNNPTCEVADVAAYVTAAKARGIRVVVDSTFAPPPLQNPLHLGADVVMHATTKYLAGHSDALGGALCVVDEAMANAFMKARTTLGSVPGSLEPWLLMRSLRTLHLRVERQANTATRLVQWLNSSMADASHELHGLVHKVYHPSLESNSPLHDVAVKQMPGGFGGCFAVELSSEFVAQHLPQSLSLFRDATSLGGVESLIEWRRKHDATISPLLLRVSIGLEDFEHLRADLLAGILRLSNEVVSK